MTNPIIEGRVMDSQRLRTDLIVIPYANHLKSSKVSRSIEKT
jgi:hypothetical protein